MSAFVIKATRRISEPSVSDCYFLWVNTAGDPIWVAGETKATKMPFLTAAAWKQIVMIDDVSGFKGNYEIEVREAQV